MFSAYGAGGIVGPYLAAGLMKVVAKVPYQVTEPGKGIIEKTLTVGNYKTAFIVSGIACLCAAAIALAIKPPKAKAA
jgi:OFA family oxalate/formate antiporter-like MFS transporter